jgi:autotransporter-associated beta strand protein
MAATGKADLAAFNTFAHSASTTTDRFADHTNNKANYLKRLTYGFSQIGDTTKPAVVPKGAEVLLETRLPYLTADQLRVVLKTTALPSGYPVMDDAEGWGRLNLFAAADGYGAFNGDVTVTMDAALGGFNAKDTWQNDISGKGLLTKSGSGTLALSGNNSYSGGTLLNAGVLEADSPTAFGTGDVYVSAGTMFLSTYTDVAVKGKYTQLSGGTLQTVWSSGKQLNVTGTATLAGTLKVLANGASLKAGDTLTVVTAGAVQGTFTTVTVAGYTAKASYTGTTVVVTIQ